MSNEVRFADLFILFFLYKFNQSSLILFFYGLEQMFRYSFYKVEGNWKNSRSARKTETCGDCIQSILQRNLFHYSRCREEKAS